MNKNLPLKITVAVTYLAMVLVNFLANALPIGGVTTGEVSDSYPNLFTPVGLTFSIWGLIYVLLLGYTLYQFGFWQKNSSSGREKIFSMVGQYFVLSSLANIAWIFAWHHGVIWLSVLIMASLLFLLIKIADVVNKKRFTFTETLFIRIPFSIYFGWITIAAIANVTVFLVSIGWNGFGIAESVWAVIILFVGAGIGITRMLKDENIYYGAVLVWAYGGIWIKHTSENGFDGKYSTVIMAVFICILLFLITMGFSLQRQKSSKK